MDSHKKRACPHYPQPYDDGDDAPLLWVGALGTLPEEDHNKHSLKWYSFLGELPRGGFTVDLFYWFPNFTFLMQIAYVVNAWFAGLIVTGLVAYGTRRALARAGV